MILDEGKAVEDVGEHFKSIVRASANLSSPHSVAHMDTAPHPLCAMTDAVVSAVNNNLLFREVSFKEAMPAEVGL